MKIAFTSDVHIPTTPKSSARRIAIQIAQEKPNVLIMGGDLGETAHSLGHFEDCLKIFRKEVPDIDILVLPGNHDLWINAQLGRPTGITKSLDLFYTHLPEITTKTGCKWLESNIFTYGEVGITGSYLHYDYSAKDKVGAFSQFPDEYFAINKGSLGNADAWYLQGINDIEFANKLSEKLRSNINELTQRSDITKIVVATHVPCMEEQITRKPYDNGWSASTAFFGNLACDADIRQNSKITHVISGHSHQFVNTHVGSIHVIVLDADYKIPKFVCVDAV